MVIASIDLKDGKVVQLKNGKDLVLQRDDADALAGEFDRYGEIAVIDLDAAMGNTAAKGTTANTEIVKRLLRRGTVRVGGGIRDVKKAKELVSLGADKVIVGSAAFCGGADGKPGTVNTVFLKELADTVGRERVVVSVDAVQGKIAVKGWTESSGIDLVEGARAVEPYAGELLFTCIEREGCMEGTDMAAVAALRGAVSCRLVAAGGVSSVDEIVRLEKMGCDVQLGMALYTGNVSLADAFVECLNWEKVDLVTVVAQAVTGEVLMVGYADKAAFRRTFETGKLTFMSRTRNTLWTKGEHSGNFLEVVRLRADCDRDTVLAVVEPRGPVCHTGSWSCFGSRPYTLEQLYRVIADRFAAPRPGSYTATLDGERVREKIIEEAGELTEAETREDVTGECGALRDFMAVLMYHEKVSWKDVLDELDRRHKK